jgi:hypothetical protein
VGKVVELPFPEFPAGTEFYDVEGVPVALKPMGVSVAFDPGPRWFPLTSVGHNGTRVSEEQFKRHVARRKDEAAPDGLHQPREWGYGGPRRWPPKS